MLISWDKEVCGEKYHKEIWAWVRIMGIVGGVWAWSDPRIDRACDWMAESKQIYSAGLDHSCILDLDLD